jgi:hypothetical protein
MWFFRLRLADWSLRGLRKLPTCLFKTVVRICGWTMNGLGKVLALALVTQWGVLVAHGQIRYLTYQAMHSPIPPMPLIQPGQQPVAPTAPAAPARVSVPPIPASALAGPQFDKTEVEKRVIEFQKQRAREGSASAAYELGLRYLKGDGVEKDAALARQWLKQAADAGHAEARKKLAAIAVPPKQ